VVEERAVPPLRRRGGMRRRVLRQGTVRTDYDVG
jgi:hypothetical protein